MQRSTVEMNVTKNAVCSVHLYFYFLYNYHFNRYCFSRHYNMTYMVHMNYIIYI